MIKILIVDDSSSLRMVIENYLKIMLPNAKYYQSSNGVEAEEVLQEAYLVGEPITLVFLDWMMPKLDGNSFLENLRGVKHFTENPCIVMLTAETYPKQINSVMKHKVFAYVTKPFSFDDLREVVKRVPGVGGEISNMTPESFVKKVV